VTPANYRQAAVDLCDEIVALVMRCRERLIDGIEDPEALGHQVSEQVHRLEVIGNNLQIDAVKLLRRAP
jgi:hypothetical protein